MRKILFILFFPLALISIVSCKEEDKWKLPVDLSVTIDLNRSSSQNNSLVFDSGEIILAGFVFDGTREQGDDVYFSLPFSSGLVAQFDPAAKIPELDFDIPQGTYNKIQISMNTISGDGNHTSDDDGDKNISDHDEGRFSIVINGSWTDEEGEHLPVRFEFNPVQYFSVVALNSQGNRQIVLETDVPVTANIVLDPVYWFGTISDNTLANAEKVEHDDEEIILIDINTNVDIYNIVANRLGLAVNLKIQ